MMSPVMKCDTILTRQYDDIYLQQDGDVIGTDDTLDDGDRFNLIEDRRTAHLSPVQPVTSLTQPVQYHVIAHVLRNNF